MSEDSRGNRGLKGFSGMKRFLARLRKEDDGAVTVDWVVLTAAMTVLAGAGYLATERGVTDATNTIQTRISEAPVK